MIAPLPALQPSGNVAVVLQGAGLGTLAGAAVAARARRRNPAADASLLTMRWSLGGAAFGLLLVVLGPVL